MPIDPLDLIKADPRDVIQKAGGPFVGPRGGKWADAKHTIPWEEEGGKRSARPTSDQRGHAEKMLSEGSWKAGATRTFDQGRGFDAGKTREHFYETEGGTYTIQTGSLGQQAAFYPALTYAELTERRAEKKPTKIQRITKEGEAYDKRKHGGMVGLKTSHSSRDEARRAASAHVSRSDTGEKSPKVQKAEGDRGGNVIGHTASGKPIYAPRSTKTRGTKVHPRHKGEMKWASPQDHKDSIDAHMGAYRDSYKKFKETGDRAHQEIGDAHFYAASNHHVALHGRRELGEAPASERKPEGKRVKQSGLRRSEGLGMEEREIIWKAAPLDLVKGGPTDMQIVEFGSQVGAVRYSNPGPPTPGYQGGLFEADQLFKAGEKPPGSGWYAVPGGKHGGYRKFIGGKYEYWYPSPKHAAEAHKYHSQVASEAGEHSRMHRQRARATSHPTEKLLHETRASGSGGLARESREVAEGARLSSKKMTNVAGSAEVLDQALVDDNAEVADNAKVFHNAKITGNARIYGNAQVHGDALISDRAKVTGNAQVSGDAKITGSAKATANSVIYGDAKITGSAKITGNAQVYGNAKIGGTAEILGGKWDGTEGEITSGRWKAPGVPADSPPRVAGERATAGTGERRVLAHTSSGKPVYENALHVEHATFSAAEHREASKIHEKEKNRLRAAPDAGNEEKAKWHSRQEARHMLAAMRESRSR